MRVAGLLLTGGSSRRMGADKAALPAWGGEGLAERTARLLSGATAPSLEVGPGWTSLPHVGDLDPGAGPLAAMASGIVALTAVGWKGPVIVVATDLPRLSAGLLGWLACHPAASSVVPVFRGRPQPLCARYSTADATTAVELARLGCRSMRALLERIDALLAGPDLWLAASGDPDALGDADTAEELARLLGVTAPTTEAGP